MMLSDFCHLTFMRFRKGIVFCLALLAVPAVTLGNPVVGNVAAGQVSIQQTTSTTTVNQTSSKAIINWQSFNIGTSESTHFQQPAGGVALNRISPTAGASQIYGRLTATGQIILSNPAGVYFGPTSYVNVGGLIATTGHISDQNFMAGNYQFDRVAGYAGSVINEGQIIAAQNGLVALVAPGVVNKGTIQANVGHVVLASGDAFTVNFSGDNLINFKITSGAASRGVDKDGNTLESGVSNTGSILANAGTVLITARAAAGVLDNSIDMRGSVQARSIYAQNGTIIVSGDPNAGVTRVSANLDASAGDTGINGGFIETSGHLVDLTGINVNLSAPGQTGTWLIDPADLNICAACTTTTAGFSAGSTNSTLLVSDLTTALASANVIVQTTVNGSGGNGDIFVDTPINWSSGNKLTLSAYRNITSSSSITNTGGASVVLQADNSGTGTGTVSFTGGNNVSLSGGSGTVKIYYNPTTFGTQDSLYTGGTTPTQYMLINSLGVAGDTTTRSLASLSNTSSLWGDNFALSADIDASDTSNWNAGAGFAPIGNGTTSFSGQFDGQGYKISNLMINLPATSNTGFFGVTTSGVNISNLAINGSVTGNGNVGLLVGVNAGTISSSFVYGQVYGNNNNIGGLVGTNSGTISNTYSMASVITAGSSEVGGLVGNNSGTINTSFSSGMVTGSSINVGGLIGSNGGAVTNSYWDINSSGKATSAGGTGATTANMMLQSTYNGFDFSNTWGIISGKSYPYLKSFYTSTPRAISGTLNATDPFSNTIYTNSNQTIKLATNSVIYDNTQTGANGFYYILLKNGALIDNYPFLVYTSGSATKGNTITVAPPSGGSVTNLPIDPNAVLVSDNGISTPIPITFLTGITQYDRIYNSIVEVYNFDYSTLSLADEIGTNHPHYDINFLGVNFLVNLGYTDTNILSSYPVATGNFLELIRLGGLNGTYVTGFHITSGNTHSFGTAAVDQSGIHFMPANITSLADLAANNKINPSILTTVNNFITNHSLGYALGNLAGNDLLYTTSASNISIKDGYNFETSSHVNYGLTGNVNTTNGSITFNGPMQVGPLASSYNKNVTVQTINSGNIKTMDLVLWAMTAPISTDRLNIVSANNIFINKPILGLMDKQNANLTSRGSLTLSAAYTDKSITTSRLGAMALDNLTISSGKFFQNNNFLQAWNGASGPDGILIVQPAMELVTLTLGTTNVQLIRALGDGTDNGTSNRPYLIGDLIGLQGIGSDSTTLAASYKIVNDINYQIPRRPEPWNGGRGFKPIGDAINPFSGSIDGLFNGKIALIRYMTITDTNPTSPNQGLFGVTSSSASISNLFLRHMTLRGKCSASNCGTGGLVGVNNGTIYNIYATGFQIDGDLNVGTLVGINNGSISNAVVVSSFANGNGNVGGLIGVNSTGASINKVLSHSYVNTFGNLSALTGGIAGVNDGIISNSFWDTSYSGQTLASSGGLGSMTNVKGGCYSGTCLYGGTVNLTTPTPYINAGWNLSNTWGVISNYSYPFLKATLGWTGIPGFGSQRAVLSTGRSFLSGDPYLYGFYPNYMSVLAGTLSTPSAQELIYFRPGLPSPTTGLYAGFTSIYRSWSEVVATGADGSFYIPIDRSSTINMTTAILLATIGGNVKGSIIIAPQNFPNQILNKNIEISTTVLSSLPNYTRATIATTAINAFFGLTPPTDPIFNTVTPFSIQTGLSPQTDNPYAYRLQYFVILDAVITNAVNRQTTYYTTSLGDNKYSIDLDSLFSDIQDNISDLNKFQQKLSYMNMINTEIIPLAPPHCSQ